MNDLTGIIKVWAQSNDFLDNYTPDDRLFYVNEQDIRNVIHDPSLQPHRLDPIDAISVEQHVRRDEQTTGQYGWRNFFAYHSANDASGDGFCLGTFDLDFSRCVKPLSLQA